MTLSLHRHTGYVSIDFKTLKLLKKNSLSYAVLMMFNREGSPLVGVPVLLLDLFLDMLKFLRECLKC